MGERTLAWVTAHCGLLRNYEPLTSHADALVERSIALPTRSPFPQVDAFEPLLAAARTRRRLAA